MASASIALQYAQAVFWAVEVTTGIGDDIVPKSQVEVFFTGFMVIVGLMMYSLIIGSASSALANIDSTATQRRQTLEKVNAFMRSRKVPNFFQRIIVDFYEHMWQTPQREADVFRDLPASLRSRLAIVMNRDLIDRIPIFKLMSASVYVRIVQRLQHNTFLPGEFVIKQGTESDYVFFVKRGKCDALLPNTEHTIYMTLFPGDVFGEQGVIFDERRSESYRAVDFLDVLMMSEMDFHELVVMAPSFVTELRRIAATRERKRLSFELALLRKASSVDRGASGVFGYFKQRNRRASSSIVNAQSALYEFARGAKKIAPAPQEGLESDRSRLSGQSGPYAAGPASRPPLSTTLNTRGGLGNVLPAHAELAASLSPVAAGRRTMAALGSQYSTANGPSLSPTNLDGSKRDLRRAGSTQPQSSVVLSTQADGSKRSLASNFSVSSHGLGAGLPTRAEAGTKGHRQSLEAWSKADSRKMRGSDA
jgi:CRP-like cAMP-binding protein